MDTWLVIRTESDWESFRNAVNAHKAYGEYLVIKK